MTLSDAAKTACTLYELKLSSDLFCFAAGSFGSIAISQKKSWTHGDILRYGPYGGIFSHHFVANNFMLSPLVKDILEFGKIFANLWARVKYSIFISLSHYLQRTQNGLQHRRPAHLNI